MFINMNTLAPFLEEPNRKFHLREYARVLKVSPATAAKYMDALLRRGLLTRSNGKLYHQFSGNVENPAFRQHKVFFTITRIIDSGLLEFFDSELAFPTVVLFGSCAKGEDIKGSDLDLFVLTNTVKELDLRGFENKLKRPIQLFVKGDKDFKEAVVDSPELMNNIINGIRLSGFLKVF